MSSKNSSSSIDRFSCDFAAHWQGANWAIAMPTWAKYFLNVTPRIPRRRKIRKRWMQGWVRRLAGQTKNDSPSRIYTSYLGLTRISAFLRLWKRQQWGVVGDHSGSGCVGYFAIQHPALESPWHVRERDIVVESLSPGAGAEATTGNTFEDEDASNDDSMV